MKHKETDTDADASQAAKPPLQVVIVGAGVAGLAAAYGLTALVNDGQVQLRIFERRTESQCLEGGYPIRLTSEARGALRSLLSPEDHEILLASLNSLPVRHDGLTILYGSGKTAYRSVSDAGEATVIERQSLCDLLRSRVADHIAYGRSVVVVQRTSVGVRVELEDGEVLYPDLVVGADGMFSRIRRTVQPDHKLRALGWQTVNMRVTSPALWRWVQDPYSLSIMLGRGWTAIYFSLVAPAEVGPGQPMYVAVTVPMPAEPRMTDPRDVLAEWADHPFIAAVSGAGTERSDAVNCFPLHAVSTTVPGAGRIVLIGDAAHGMTPFTATGAGAGVVDGVQLIDTIRRYLAGTDWEMTETEIETERLGLDEVLERFRNASKRRNDPLVDLSVWMLWLVQGETAWKRILRASVFTVLRVWEKLRGKTRKEDARLQEYIRQVVT